MGYDSDDWWEEFHEPGGEYYDHEFEGAYGSEALRQHQEARARRRRLEKEFRLKSEYFMGACYSGDAAEVTRIYDEGGPKHFDPYGNIVTDTWSEYDGMDSAIKYGHTEVLRILLQRGSARLRSDIGSVAAERKSPAHVALLGGHVDVARVLLDEGFSPYHVARERLLSLFGNTWRQSIYYSPLYGACTFAARFTGPRAEGAAGVRLLLERGVDIDWKAGPYGQTHLHHAVLENNGDVARVLLLHGADIYCGDEKGRSPLDYLRIGRCSHSQPGGTRIDEVFNSYLPTYWKRLFAVTLGRKHDVPELGGQRIAPLIGSFVVGDVSKKPFYPGDVLVKKK